MGDFDPVPWDVREAAIGTPAAEIAEAVDERRADVSGDDPYHAVKTVHDSLYDAEAERTVPSLGEPFITAYLLERRGVIDPDDDEYRSLVDRRPSTDRLEELFWERKRTLWWIGMVVGVHPSLVTYWLYEDDIPLMERNYTAESLAKIRASKETTNE